MKKLLVLALSAVMVLALATVSMAAVTVSGEVIAKYNFESALGVNSEDKYEGKIAFDGKVNDSVTAKIVYKFDNDTAVKVDEYWFNVAGDMGELKVGRFGWGTNGKRDIIEGTLGDLKAEAGMGYTLKADAITFRAFYAADETAAGDTALGDNGIGLALAYDTESFGVELVLVDTALTAVETAYVVNAYIIPMEGLTAYAQIGSDETEAEIAIVGAVYTAGALTLRGEFGLGDDNEDAWGIAAQYAAANGLTYKYTRKNSRLDAIETSEFKVSVAF